MKILVLADLSSPHTLRWISSLRERGTKVRALSFEEPLLGESGFIHIKTQIKSKRWKYVLNSRKVKRIVKEFNPDLLNPHFVPNYGLLARIAGEGIPYFLCAWGSDLLITPKKGWLQRFWTRRVLERAEAVYVDSKMLVEVLLSLGVSEERILLFPFGVPRYWREVALGDYKPGPQWHLFTHRRLDPDMDPMTVLKAFSMVLESQEDSHITFASRGILERRLKKLVRDLGIEKKVTFSGWQTEERLMNLLQRSHFYISASLTDSTSVSLLEAMASGAFPIVSNIRGNREWIRDGENGLLFEPQNPEDLAKKILLAMKREDLVNEARRRNKEIIEERANWEENFEVAYERMKELVSLRKTPSE